MKLLSWILLGASTAAVPAAVGAQAQAQPQASAPTVAANPDEVICEKQEVTGSRLAHRKVCMTRSQWQETRREDRKTVEKAQSERGLIGEPPG